MSIIYKLIDVGRAHWSGEVVIHQDDPEYIEAKIEQEARKHLGSRDVQVVGEIDKGIILAGMRPVGRFERVLSERAKEPKP